MAALSEHYMDILKRELWTNYVPYLPPLLAINGATPQQQAEKQIARAFSAFLLNRYLDVAGQAAAKAVVDDFNDNGIDAVWYKKTNDTLYLVQSKLRSGEQFSQDDALAFCAGVRLVLKQEFATFNANFLVRQTEVENALETCSHIRLVVGYVGAGVSAHATAALDQLLADADLDEERLSGPVEYFTPEMTVAALLAEKAYKPVNADIWLRHYEKIEEPQMTYYGVVRLKDLVDLHNVHGKALYERNIRYFLGSRDSEVNKSIQSTLINDPGSFFYLNNGVTALCDVIDPKGKKGGEKKLKVLGFSVINGAQTVASAAELLQKQSPPDISKARVLLTLIKANAQGAFGARITRARNHQNPVSTTNFASLDPEQERLRQELAYYQINYHYRPEAKAASDSKNILLQEAIVALAWLQSDPRFAIWLKGSPSSVNNADTESYKQLFASGMTGLSIANAVTYLRCMQGMLRSAQWSSNGMERLMYRHGLNAIGWTFSKRLRKRIQSANLVNPATAQQEISQQFDELRQQAADLFAKLYIDKGPLAFFRNQGYSVPYLERLMETNYGLSAHPAIAALKVAAGNEAFPRERLFKFMSQQAPQI